MTRKSNVNVDDENTISIRSILIVSTISRLECTKYVCVVNALAIC
jgi:hypothetical protein